MKTRRKQNAKRAVSDYDEIDTSEMVDASKRLSLSDVGLKLKSSAKKNVNRTKAA